MIPVLMKKTSEYLLDALMIYFGRNIWLDMVLSSEVKMHISLPGHGRVQVVHFLLHQTLPLVWSLLPLSRKYLKFPSTGLMVLQLFRFSLSQIRTDHVLLELPLLLGYASIAAQ